MQIMEEIQSMTDDLQDMIDDYEGKKTLKVECRCEDDKIAREEAEYEKNMDYAREAIIENK